MAEWKSDAGDILDRLPLNYDDTTLKTIEQIDVQRLRGRSIRRALEVEHNNFIYSGLRHRLDVVLAQATGRYGTLT